MKSEVALQRQLHGLGFTTRAQFLRNVAIRASYRLVPEVARKAAYRKLIARKGER
ncbi:MAG: hypothetical protein H0U51_03825 [Propionibacteriales bacterium]|nr:hypothetical protein [Propionibacteriales bacterium]